MKKIFFISTLAVVCSALFAPVQAEEAAEPSVKDDLSYFFGYSFGNMLRQGGNTDVDLDRLKAGLAASIAGAPPALSQEQQQAVIAVITERQNAIKAEQAAAQERAAVQQQEASKKFLAANAAKEGVTTTASGLQYEVLSTGDGIKPVATNKVRVHYEGRLINGEVFDSSIQRGEPAEFGLNRVIAGWTEGLQLMPVGSKYRFTIPPELGYGSGGTGRIPGNAVLVFDVELLGIIE